MRLFRLLDLQYGDRATDFEQDRLNLAYINLNELRPAIFQEAVNYLWIFTEKQGIVFGIEKPWEYPQAFTLNPDETKNKELWDSIKASAFENPRFGHPTLGVSFSQETSEMGNILEGAAYLGGEFYFSKKTKTWILNNQSGRYGRFDTVSDQGSDHKAEEEHQWRVISTLCWVKTKIKEQFAELEIDIPIAICPQFRSLFFNCSMLINENLLMQEDLIALIQNDSRTLKYLVKELFSNYKELLIELIKKAPLILQPILEVFKDNQHWVQFIDGNILVDQCIVLTAIKETPEIIPTLLEVYREGQQGIQFFAQDFLLKHQETVLSTIKNKPLALLNILNGLMNKDQQTIQFIGEYILLNHDEEILAAIVESPISLLILLQQFKNNQQTTQFSIKAFFLKNEKKIVKIMEDNPAALLGIFDAFKSDQNMSLLLEHKFFLNNEHIIPWIMEEKPDSLSSFVERLIPDQHNLNFIKSQLDTWSAARLIKFINLLSPPLRGIIPIKTWLKCTTQITTKQLISILKDKNKESAWFNQFDVKTLIQREMTEDERITILSALPKNKQYEFMREIIHSQLTSFSDAYIQKLSRVFSTLSQDHDDESTEQISVLKI